MLILDGKRSVSNLNLRFPRHPDERGVRARLWQVVLTSQINIDVRIYDLSIFHTSNSFKVKRLPNGYLKVKIVVHGGDENDCLSNETDCFQFEWNPQIQ